MPGRGLLGWDIWEEAIAGWPAVRGEFEVVGLGKQGQCPRFDAPARQILGPVDQFEREFEKGRQIGDRVVWIDDGDAVHARGLVEQAPSIDGGAAGAGCVWGGDLAPGMPPPDTACGVLWSEQRDHLSGGKGTAWLIWGCPREWPQRAVERHVRPPWPRCDVLTQKCPADGERAIEGGVTSGWKQAEWHVDDGEMVGHG